VCYSSFIERVQIKQGENKMGTMSNSDFDAYVREYFDNMETYTNNHKMMVLRRVAVNIKQLYTSEAMVSFLTHMQDVEYIKNEWPKMSNNNTWIKRHSILMHTDLLVSIADYASIFLGMFTLKALYAYFPKDSTVFWQKIGGYTVGRPVYDYKTTFQVYSAISDSNNYPFSIVTHAVADAMDLEVEGHFIAQRGNDITTDLWRMAEMLYGDKTALKYMQM
jgi:hypothetical protein